MKKIKILVLSILLISTSFPTAEAAPILPTSTIVGANLKAYVKPTACDIKVPENFSKIQQAIDAASPGYTICVGGAAYNENLNVNKTLRLSGNGFTNRSVIKSQNAGGGVYINADNVILEGFIIYGFGPDYQDAGVVIGENRSNSTVRYNRIISGKGGLALRTDGFQKNDLLQNNNFEGKDSPQIVLINGQPTVGKPSDDIKILNNTFVGSLKKTTRDDTGIALQTGATNNIINKNVFDVSGEVVEVIQCAFDSNTVEYNNFKTKNLIKIRTSLSNPTIAKYNWWGDKSPVDNIQGSATFTPYSNRPYTEYPFNPQNSVNCTAILCENFNSYSDGPVVSQGDWYNRATGLPYVVQSTVTQEGAKALKNTNTGADEVITKRGRNTLVDGRQSFYVRTKDRANWGNYDIGQNVQIGVFQDSWDGPSRAMMAFMKDGHVAYLDARTDLYTNFETYQDNVWNLIDMEWRASDTSARYRLNNDNWTDWIPFIVRPTYAYFDTIGMVTQNLGTGSVYIDNFH